MIKKLSLFCLVLAIWLFPKTTALALDEFSTTYDVKYDVNESGETLVNQKIILRNLTSQYYVSNFTLTIGSTNISEIEARDDTGPMETTVDKKENKTSINVKLNQQVAGIDKTQTLNIKFKSKDFAESIGKTWEVNLPKMPSASNIENYVVTLSVPLSFGDPTSMSPKANAETQTASRLIYGYTKKQLESSGISLTFGTTQVFDYTINYDLENPSLVPIITSVALPPDTEYQEIYLNKIEPTPLNVTIDEDGNYLAWYKVPTKSSIFVTLSGSAKLRLEPKSKQVEKLTATEINHWTKSDKYWEKDNPLIKNLLSEIFKGGMPQSTKEKVRLIYRYVVDTLEYDNSRVSSDNLERLGAITALNNPDNSVCMEFTDLFVALTRAAGIPARELDGFAYSQNKNLRPSSMTRDLLHAWPEYYDPTLGWVMVDPTWENTSGGVDYFNKFDLNHLVFAIKGVSSTTPFVSENVKVTISTNDFVADTNKNFSLTPLSVAIDAPENLWSGLPATATVTVANTGHMLHSPTTLGIRASTLAISGPNTVKIEAIPPFGSATYKFNLKSENIFQNFDDNIEVIVSDKTVSKKISIRPLIYYQPVPYLFIGIIGFILIIYLATLSIHIFKTKPEAVEKV